MSNVAIRSSLLRQRGTDLAFNGKESVEEQTVGEVAAAFLNTWLLEKDVEGDRKYVNSV